MDGALAAVDPRRTFLGQNRSLNSRGPPTTLTERLAEIPVFAIPDAETLH
jgi:hypothetical protein